MKFGTTHSKHRHAHTTSALPATQHRYGNTSKGISRTPWEERIARAKKLTASRQSGEQTNISAEKASAAYLQWLEQRTARIEELRSRIETGTYHISSATLASDLLRKTSLDSENDSEGV